MDYRKEVKKAVDEFSYYFGSQKYNEVVLIENDFKELYKILYKKDIHELETVFSYNRLTFKKKEKQMDHEPHKEELYRDYLKGMFMAGSIGDVNYTDTIVNNALYEAELLKQANKTLQERNDNQKLLIESQDKTIASKNKKINQLEMVLINKSSSEDMEIVNKYLLKCIADLQNQLKVNTMPYYISGDKTWTVNNTWGGTCTSNTGSTTGAK